jgi:hypothetical protein
MTSAASRATSAAVMTEIPTSALCREGASLIPSPMYPTTCPRRCSAAMIRSFCAGETRVNTDACSATQRRLLPGAVSEDRGGRGHRRPESIRSLLRSVRLPEVDRDTEDDHRDDDHRIDGLPEGSGNRARDEKNDDEGIREEVQQLDDGRQTVNGSRLVRAVLGEAARRLGVAQSLFGTRHHSVNRLRKNSRQCGIFRYLTSVPSTKQLLTSIFQAFHIGIAYALAACEAFFLLGHGGAL